MHSAVEKSLHDLVMLDSSRFFEPVFFLDAPSPTIIYADVMVKYSKTHADPQGWTFFLVHYHIPKIHIHISTMLCAC